MEKYKSYDMWSAQGATGKHQRDYNLQNNMLQTAPRALRVFNETLASQQIL